MAFAISVVIATHNRQMALERLLSDLARQSPPATDFEVVDNGPSTPVTYECTRTPITD